MADSNPSELILAVQGPEQMRSFPRKWVRAAIAKGEIKRSQLIWSPNHNEWKQLRDLPHLMPTMELAPLPQLAGVIATPSPVPTPTAVLARRAEATPHLVPSPRVAALPVAKSPTAGIPTVAKVAVPTVAKAAVPTAVKVATPGVTEPPKVATPSVTAVTPSIAAAVPITTGQPPIVQTPPAAQITSATPVTLKPTDASQPTVDVASAKAAQPAVVVPPSAQTPSNTSPAPAPSGQVPTSGKTPSQSVEDAKKAILKKSAERDYVLPVARAVAVCSFLLLVGLVCANYFLVESPFSKQLSANGLSKLSAYATFGGFYQLDVLTVHLSPSPELKRGHFAQTLIGLAKSSPRTSVNGQGWIVVSLTPGLSGGYIIQGNDWKDLGALANQPEVQQKLYILSVMHDYNNAVLLDSAATIDPARTELTDRESRAWNLLVKTFIP